jgi:hypothetical protein
MSEKKTLQRPQKNQVSLVRSSAAEYLTFVAASGHSETSVEMRYEDENVWLTQKMMATLYDVSVPAINQHLKRIYADRELEREATVKKYLTVQAEGSRQVQREVERYNLQAIIAVGFKIENERAVQFRKWATTIVEEFTIKGYTMDDERLKNYGSVLTKQHFEEQLQRIREIPYRASQVV